MGRREMFLAHLRRIEAEVFGYLIELDFERNTRLWCSMPALRPTRRLIGNGAHPAESIVRNQVGDRLQRAGIEGRRDSITAVRSAVEERLKVHGSDCAVSFHSGLDLHEHRMTPSMAIEDLLACERDFNRPAGDHSQLRDCDLVIERVCFAAEAAVVRCGNYEDMAARKFQDFGECPMNVVRSLCRSP